MMHARRLQDSARPAMLAQPKVLFCIPRYWPSMGGAELHTREMARRLHGYGSVGVVYHCSVEALPAEVAFAHAPTHTIDDAGIPVHQIGARGFQRPLLQGLGRLYTRTRWVRPLYTALFKTAVQKTLQRIATDYDLIHAVYNGLTPSTVLVADVCQALDIPFVWTPLAHTTLPPGTGWSSRSFRRLYARADALIAMTAFEQDWLVAQGAAPERVHVCPVAPLLDGTANPQRFRASYDVGDAPMVLFLSRLVDTKGYKQLCDAARLVWAQSPRTLFVFVGPCAPEVQRWFAAQREPRLRVLGPLDEGDKVSALAACDVLCVPSSEESLGVTYLEAWSFAKPVVALALPVLRTVIAHGVDGLLTPPQSPALADALVYLLEHPDVRQAMGQCGAQKVAAHYDWDVLAQRLSGIYQAVLQTRRRVHTSRASGVLSETKP